jgi:hypothetical protein
MKVSNTDLTYSQEDIQQILNLAIASQSSSGEFSREQLLEIAAELSIPASEIQKAEQAWQQKNSLMQRRKDFDAYLRAKLQHRTGRFLIVNAFLMGLNSLTGLSALMIFSLPWSAYPVLIWGMFLALDAWYVLRAKGEAYEEEFQRWDRKHQLRQLMYHWQGRLQNLLFNASPKQILFRGLRLLKGSR